MLSIKKVIHIDLNSLYSEMTANGEKIPSTFEDFLAEIYCDDLEYGIKLIRNFLKVITFDLITIFSGYLRFAIL